MNKKSPDKYDWKVWLIWLAFVTVFYLIVIPPLVNRWNESNEKRLKTQPKEQLSSVSEEVLEEDKEYIYNSLPTGYTPYTAYYGKNYKCPNNQCSGIKVTAPRESDIVVVIKRNNQQGKVIAHGYIRAGATYRFDIPDGIYQTFFYYGEGWNPNKDMGDGVKGGFVKNELYSKDLPQDIYSGVLSYVLQLQRDGNFQTKESSREEFF